MILSINPDIVIIIVFNLIFSIMIFYAYYKQIDSKQHPRYFIIPVLYSLIPPALSMILFILIQPVFKYLDSEILVLMLFFVIILPGLEELLKRYAIDMINNRVAFTSISEGMLVGALVGVIFAFIENIVYSIDSLFSDGYIAAINLIVIRGIVSFIGHPLYSSINGSSVAVTNFLRGYGWRKDLMKSWMLHSLWNFIFLTPIFLNLKYSYLNASTYFGSIIITAILISTFFKERDYAHNFDYMIRDKRIINLKMKIK